MLPHAEHRDYARDDPHDPAPLRKSGESDGTRGLRPEGLLQAMANAAGKGDIPHDHPVHYLYVVNGGKLKLSPPPGQTEV